MQYKRQSKLMIMMLLSQLIQKNEDQQLLQSFLPKQKKNMLSLKNKE
jgi:hypothetical protein